MTRRISLQYAFVIILSLVAFVIGSTLIVRNNLHDITEENLFRYLDIVQNEYEERNDFDEVINQFLDLDDYLRITFISETGEVLADSQAITVENHLDRPEIINPGTVYSRYSDTLNKDMMYLAVQFDTGVYLRIAIPTSNILPYLNAFIGISLMIGVIIAIASIFGSHYIAKQILVPLHETAHNLEMITKGQYTERLPLEKNEEMNIIINEINDISRLISQTIQSLNTEKRKRDFILDHMDQGLCVLDSSGRIVMINRYVTDLFEFDTNNLNKDFLYLFRDSQIQTLIKTVISDDVSGNIMFFVGDHYYSLVATPIKNDWNNSNSIVLIITDITEINNLEIRKRDFFLNASHELKSPLTSIIGSADLIANGLAKNDFEIMDLAKRIVLEASRMNNLVMDMLNLSKYENNIYIKGDQLIDMVEVIKDVQNVLQPNAKKRGITINVETEPVILRADYEQMVQLVRNLVDNSIQYGIDNGMITIRLCLLSEGFRLEVEDNGIGIPKADQARVFERFYRVDKARSKTTGGTGLGLSIVKHICMIHQARIELESETQKGTKISIIFPQKQ